MKHRGTEDTEAGEGRRIRGEAGGKARGRGGVPLAVWVVGGVVALHVVFFWWAADKHFLPRTRYIPPPPTPNFAARRTVTTAPQTGEVTTRSDFVVSTRLATPVPGVRPKGSPANR